MEAPRLPQADASLASCFTRKNQRWDHALLMKLLPHLLPVAFSMCCFVGAAPAQTAGSLDASFNPGTGADARVFSVACQADGKLILGGQFSRFDGVARNRVVRLQENGAVDMSFVVGTGADSSVNSVAVAPDGKVLVGGDFYGFNGFARSRLARLGTDGTVDSAFAPTVDGTVQSVAVDSVGRVYLAGGFTTVNGLPRPRVARLLAANGQVDPTFDPGTGPNATVLDLALQPDGKVLLAGRFTAVGGVTRHRVARLNSDGSLDTGFVPGTLDNGYANTIQMAPDGKVVVGGGLHISQSTRLLRLNADGAVDSTFQVGNNVINSDVTTLVVQADGKVLIGGYFTAINGLSRNGVARLNVNGTLDTDFDPGTGANHIVWALLLQPDGQLVAAGSFTAYQGINRNYITRINNTYVNRPPTLNPVPQQALYDGVAPAPVLLTGISPGPATEFAQSVTNVIATSSDVALVPHPSVTYSAGDTSAVLTLTAVPGAVGVATVTVVVRDNGGTAGGGVDRTTNTFLVSVNVPNTAPSFALAAGSVTVAEDAGARTIPAFATNILPGPASEAGQAVSFLVAADPASLFSVGPVIQPNGTLTFTGTPNANGTATITVRARDNGGTALGGADTSAAQTFTINITPVNDPPQVSFASNVVVMEESVTFAPQNNASADNSANAAPGTPVVSAFNASAYPASPGQLRKR